MAVAIYQTHGERDFRGPGCTALCHVIPAVVPGRFGRTELMQHDIPGHEAYGMAMGAAHGQSTLDIATGPLLVRLATAEVYVNGALLYVTPTEWHIVKFLAERSGQLVRLADILAAVWPDWVQPHQLGRQGGRYVRHADAHLVRVHVNRIRAKLGPARSLLVTRPGVGLVLERRPYTGPVPDEAGREPLGVQP